MQATLQTAQHELTSSEREYLWPTSEFFVSENHRLVYCPIPKVACSSLKLWWADLIDGSARSFTSLNEKGEIALDHQAINDRFKLHHQSLDPNCQPLTGDDWFRVAFVRDPWSRLVSSFLNKFLDLYDVTGHVFSHVHSRWKEPAQLDNPNSTSQPPVDPYSTTYNRMRKWLLLNYCGEQAWQGLFTFRQFVEYLSACDLDGPDIDLHWCPQYRFLGVVNFHLIGRFERLSSDFQVVASRLGVRADLPAVNCTSYQPEAVPKGNFADCPLETLRKLRAMPDYRQFYTPALVEQVADLYRIDIERFGYEFRGPQFPSLLGRG